MDGILYFCVFKTNVTSYMDQSRDAYIMYILYVKPCELYCIHKRVHSKVRHVTFFVTLLYLTQSACDRNSYNKRTLCHVDYLCHVVNRRSSKTDGVKAFDVFVWEPAHVFKGVALGSCQQMGPGTFETPPQRLNSRCMSAYSFSFIRLYAWLHLSDSYCHLSGYWREAVL